MHLHVPMPVPKLTPKPIPVPVPKPVPTNPYLNPYPTPYPNPYTRTRTCTCSRTRTRTRTHTPTPSVDGRDITAEGVAQLAAALPSLLSLQWLRVLGTRISPAGIDDIDVHGLTLTAAEHEEARARADRGREADAAASAINAQALQAGCLGRLVPGLAQWLGRGLSSAGGGPFAFAPHGR